MTSGTSSVFFISNEANHMKTEVTHQNTSWLGYAIALVLILLSTVTVLAQWTTPDANNNIKNTNSGNVGIGTTSPTAGLEITPASGRYGVIINAGDAGSLRWGNGAQGALSWDSGKALVYALAGHDLSFGAGNS